jgi:hypothetical protein
LAFFVSSVVSAPLCSVVVFSAEVVSSARVVSSLDAVVVVVVTSVVVVSTVVGVVVGGVVVTGGGVVVVGGSVVTGGGVVVVVAGSVVVIGGVVVTTTGGLEGAVVVVLEPAVGDVVAELLEPTGALPATADLDPEDEDPEELDTTRAAGRLDPELAERLEAVCTDGSSSEVSATERSSTGAMRGTGLAPAAEGGAGSVGGAGGPMALPFCA